MYSYQVYVHKNCFSNCRPVYPWNFVRVNTIFGVIHQAGGYTAWADKHAAYASVSGPTGTNTPSNIDDYYSPDVNSNVVALPGIVTATGLNCATIPVSGAWTDGFDSIKCNDQLKVNAVLNWIQGKSHLGTKRAPVPTVFGMDFQAVSVGQKLIAGGVKGGYTDAEATPTPEMQGEIEFVDAAIGQMVTALTYTGLLSTTAIVITAKHGQSPIDPTASSRFPATAGPMARRLRESLAPRIFPIPRSTRSDPRRTIFHSFGSSRTPTPWLP